MEHVQVVITDEQAETTVEGWSVSKDILGEPVYNDQHEEIGTIDDLIVAPDDSISFAIIGAGGFLGIAKHDVAIPMQQLEFDDGEFVLPGATKDELKSLPKFEYASDEEKKAH